MFSVNFNVFITIINITMKLSEAMFVHLHANSLGVDIETTRPLVEFLSLPLHMFMYSQLVIMA